MWQPESSSLKSKPMGVKLPSYQIQLRLSELTREGLSRWHLVQLSGLVSCYV